MDDIISSFPDELLCHILSFLPTDQAVVTSVLSKRWRPLWTSVPVLDYDNQIDSISSNFERLISETILGRDVKQSITSFRLRYEIRYARRANVDVNDWVNTVVQRGIENLDIMFLFMCYCGGCFINLSCRIFSCKTLVVLKMVRVSLPASSSVNFPSLKSLHLEYVKFEEPQYLVELLYGCPMLEYLKTCWLQYAHDGSFCKKRLKILPKLVRADMDRDTTHHILLEFMITDKFGGNDDDDGVVPEFPHLRHVTVVPNSIENLLLLLKNCPKLQSLKFRAGSFRDEEVLPSLHFVPECLVSCLSNCYLDSFEGTKIELQFAKYIMQNSTFLRSMKIRPLLCETPQMLQVLEELALYPRKSASCELSFILSSNPCFHKRFSDLQIGIKISCDLNFY